jgi:hypothetical protein
MSLATNTYQKWLDNPLLTDELREELLAVKSPDEIEDRFYRDLKFGTGGLRGVLGAGTNRMNVYTVRKATLGLARYLLAWYWQLKVSVPMFLNTCVRHLRCHSPFEHWGPQRVSW